MALTFVRTSELIGAKWSEFDLDAARWDIPAERMKMRTPHIVPLARQSVEILHVLRELSGDSDWGFPGEGDEKPLKRSTEGSDGVVALPPLRLLRAGAIQFPGATCTHRR
jgi:integrase